MSATHDITAPPSHDGHHTVASKSGSVYDEGDKAATPVEVDDGTQKPEILSKRRFLPLYFGMLLSVMLISLDQTIVATAQVPIVDSLGGASLIAWLPTTFLLGQCSFSLLFGQLLTIFPSKYVYLCAIVLFELGSLVSGVAPNMGAMLAGRTISGVGAAGIFMGVVQVLVETTTLASRAAYTGALGALFAISMVVGPLIGGSLADKVTWRWCFYINLPIGGVTVVAIVLLFNARAALGSKLDAQQRPSLWTQLSKLDWVGVVLLTGITCMVIVPMQLAQNQAGGWTSAATLVPICLTPVAVALTGTWFWYRERTTKDELRAILPLRLFTDGNLIGCSVATAVIFWVAIEMTYLIPLFYETVLGHTALKSGVDMLGFVLSFGLCAVFGGMLSRISGHYYPQFVVCPVLGIVASALMYLTKADSSTGFHVGTQILLGVAIGPMIQSPMLALQANCPDKRLIARALSFMAFCQRFGGGVGSSLTGAVLYAQLPSHIRRQLVAIDVDPTPYLHTSYDQVRFAPQGPIRDAMLRALTQTMDDICLAGIPLFAIVLAMVVFLVRVRNIKTEQEVFKLDFLARRVLRRSAQKSQQPE